ncbi:hypothetical protein KIN20_034010 [Parelaphostrongylus tenuis]|uniref:Uncharacterized protein n=1 Tax=Parelaphostrongylus tenuis TaxID=148309 RepID=A0AAD5WIX6_PARTN|nr:hypothetical protein KIN20_034010 [Parelaphostrongylus tenuis]
MVECMDMANHMGSGKPHLISASYATVKRDLGVGEVSIYTETFWLSYRELVDSTDDTLRLRSHLSCRRFMDYIIELVQSGSDEISVNNE